MTDSLNKKISFPNSSISVKPISKIKETNNSKVFLVQDSLNAQQLYTLKIIRANSSDFQQVNSINNEVIILVYINCLIKNYLKNNVNIIGLIDYFFVENNNECNYYILLEYCGSIRYFYNRW